MKAFEKLVNKNKDDLFICVGLDSDINKIPAHLKTSDNPIYNFNKKIIEHTKKNVAAYKLNFAFYEKDGLQGIKNLEKTLSEIPDDVLIIADAKRGDIGNTSKMYASSVFEYFKCDAVTVNPYMGEDSVLPFLDYEEKLIFILALTSNPGAENFEKLKLENGKLVFQTVIEKVNSWNSRKNCGIVFGATNLEELRINIKSFNKIPVLLPGIGAQGGSFDEVVNTFIENDHKNFIINSSRGIIYKSSKEDFAEIAAEQVSNYNKKIKNIIAM